MTPYARYGKGLLGVYQDLCSISATLSDSRGTNFFHSESVASSWALIFAINGPVRTTRNFVCFAKKSVNAKPFVVRTIFVTHQNFRKCHQTSNTPSTSFGGLQFFVRRANVLFLDRYPSTGHHIS